MNSIDKLTEIFSRFPGIGPRQAKRFVYFLLSRDASSRKTLAQAITALEKEINQCSECMRYFPRENLDGALCPTCVDENRDHSLLMLVSRDMDFEVVEKSGTYKGYYFILGGAIPILEKEPEKRIRIKELKERLPKKVKNGLKEVILAMNANAEGENTAEYLKEILAPILGEKISITLLGRGLSTGAELEYADPETLKNALLHRTK